MIIKAYIRGGSWLSPRRVDYLGFRVVLPTEKKTRVVRGGSWFINRDDARADYRLSFHPVDRFVNRGFRVLCASNPIPSNR